jgi:hypothetical protein
MPEITDSFSALLSDFDLAALDAHEGSIVGVDGELRIEFLSAGWYRFAAQNEGEPVISERWGLGRNPSGTPFRRRYMNFLRACLPQHMP